ncbi:uncharacterized protein LY79DRAFT_662446 [Colletotrichum navitas]|uniref:Tyrosinase C-terminal domain-containing protein n=1 Tax=Colletotrichum navitas TaxID=681940 RepID=A0AAD8PQL4_9PEZI|nr:uncharacterized protein LY79DRAFT_662446 [Colletotrichum navitas]KAK1573964.1 hypothetical protein LY79DRAFT_662446 [Colletotrichum navitas]
MTHWNATCSVDKFSLDGSFTVFFFLGDFSPDVESWIVDSHLAGFSGIFANSRAAITIGACANCAKHEAGGIKYMDTVALTPALLTYWDSQEEHYGCRVGDLRPDYVLPFLARNLHWRVVNNHGAQAPRETIPSLKVMVYPEIVTLPHNIADKPRFEGQNVHYEVTNGRPGGMHTVPAKFLGFGYLGHFLATILAIKLVAAKLHGDFNVLSRTVLAKLMRTLKCVRELLLSRQVLTIVKPVSFGLIFLQQFPT